MKEILYDGVIKGIPLIKFQNSSIIDRIINGSFFMNSLKTFRERYYSCFDEEIGDPHEGMLYVNRGTMIVGEPMIEVAPLKNAVIPTATSNDYVFCMFGINPKYYSSFRFSEEQKNKWLEIYDTALVITDSDEFIKRVNNQAKNQGIELDQNFVKYYDAESGDITPWLSSLVNGIKSVAYYKRKRYEYQQEFRFTARNRTTEDHIEINIGSIADIAKTFPLKSFLNAEIQKKSNL